MSKHVDSDQVALSGVTYESIQGIPKFEVERPVAIKTSGLQVLQPLTITYTPSQGNINIIWVELDSSVTAKSEALECMVGIGGASKVRWPCFYEDYNISHPNCINISTIELSSSLTAGTEYIFEIRTVGADDGVNGFLLPAGSQWIPINIWAVNY